MFPLGLYYDWQGRCEYVLWRGNGLEIQVRNSECSPLSPRPSVSCTDAVAFLAGTANIRFDTVGAFVNNNPITSVPTTINGVIISSNYGYRFVLTCRDVVT